MGTDGTPIVYDRVFIPGDRFRITRNLKYDTTTVASNDAYGPIATPRDGSIATGPIASREAVRMSAEGAKKPSRQTEIFHVQPL